MRAKQKIERKVRRAAWWKRVNAEWPWLKFGLAFLAIFLAVFVSAKAFVPVRESERRPAVQNLGLAAPKVALSQEALKMKLKGKKVVALTFDDGPSQVTTPRLLEILAEKQVHATFFMVGKEMLANPDLARRVENEGHEIGGHTVGHEYLTLYSADEIKANRARTDEIFKSVLGREMTMMRPPGGFVDEKVLAATGVPIIYWTIDTVDWRDRNAKTVRERAVSEARDGAMILMHDIHATTVEAVEGIIDDLRSQGYEFVTVSELATVKGVKLTAGTVYYAF